MFKRLLLLKQIPIHPNLGRLALRLIVFLPLFLKYGTVKLLNFGAMAQHFPDPIHIGPVPSLFIATIADGICSLLIVVGLATRWASAFQFCSLFVAWVFVHHFLLFGRTAEHGELMVLYMGSCVALFLLGGGKFSIDALIDRDWEKQQAASGRAHAAKA